MIFTAMSDGSFRLDGRITRCALGKGGVIAAADKREGDGKSPLGTWGIRRVLFRPDKGGPRRRGCRPRRWSATTAGAMRRAIPPTTGR